MSARDYAAPAYRDARATRAREYRARKRGLLPARPGDYRANDGWAPCAGCGRRFPAGSLRAGACGGWWCRSGGGAP